MARLRELTGRQKSAELARETHTVSCPPPPLWLVPRDLCAITLGLDDATARPSAMQTRQGEGRREWLCLPVGQVFMEAVAFELTLEEWKRL